MLQAENLLRGILRLFFWGMVVTFGVLIVENQPGGVIPQFLQMIWPGMMIGLIMIPAVVLSGYLNVRPTADRGKCKSPTT